MQDKNISISEIVGTPQTDTWAQVFVGNNTQQNDRGKLFYLINLKNQTDEETALIGKLLSERFEENYYQSTETPFESLKKALTGLNEVAISRGVNDVEAAAIVFVNNIAYVSVLNGSSVFVKRSEKFVCLLKGDNGTDISSGFFQEGDYYILASSGFINLVSLEMIKSAIDHNTPEDISQGLAPIVLGSPVNSTCACLILRINKNKIVEENSTEIPKVFDTNNESKEETVEEKKTVKTEIQKIKIVEKIKSFVLSSPLNKMVGKIRGLNIKNSIGSGFYAKSPTKKTAVSVVVIILILLTVSGVLGKYRQEEERRIAKFNDSYDQAVTKFEEGKAIIDLNNTQARSYLNTAKALIEKDITLLNKKSTEFNKGQKMLSEINLSLADISGIVKIDNPALYYDLTLIKDNAKGDLMSLYKKTLGVLDGQNSSIYLLDLDAKSPTTLVGADFKNTGYFVQGVSSFFFSKEKGVLKVEADKKTTNPVVVDKEWGDIGSIGTFGGNIYLLDKTKGEILKYVPVEGGYADKKSYLPKDIKPDFQSVIQLVIDGYVWVFKNDGTAMKYAQGRPLDFVISGLDLAFKNPTRMYSSDATKNLYILDKGNNRVVVINKESGIYQSQYLWRGITGVTDLVVIEEEKKMFLLSGSKLYLVELK